MKESFDAPALPFQVLPVHGIDHTGIGAGAALGQLPR